MIKGISFISDKYLMKILRDIRIYRGDTIILREAVEFEVIGERKNIRQIIYPEKFYGNMCPTHYVGGNSTSEGMSDNAVEDRGSASSIGESTTTLVSTIGSKTTSVFTSIFFAIFRSTF